MTEGRLGEYLDHMVNAAQDAASYLEGVSKESFLQDRRTQQAVIMNLIIVGEAATRVMERHAEFAAKHAHIPWRSMRGMRNRIAHGYFDIDLDVVWDTVQTALPSLIEMLNTARPAAPLA